MRATQKGKIGLWYCRIALTASEVILMLSYLIALIMDVYVLLLGLRNWHFFQSFTKFYVLVGYMDIDLRCTQHQLRCYCKIIKCCFGYKR